MMTVRKEDAMRVISTIPKSAKGQTFYCNCQKEDCYPCQSPAKILAETEDGTLQLCRDCAKEYQTAR